ncbi:MAG: hypothetical protein HN411_04160 [Waddliaceae bacterium]|jgi:Kdo2-lipid IVA lauroyltransferase/acyltransferase|nr:hypothetical protein [Waddliaceae bacterium]MBT3578775.1 hypothetical protein [Waddliaceae bacterium]MBT4445326.1 hypothetical protein [Waddliaceae bacterium]MBT6928622.1 hypothetical protein [Waddliaceae bacterium]MBT7265114.1 hypothetical protein [Waddliaceae bacterium]
MISTIKYAISYSLLRCVIFPLSLLPYSMLRSLGRFIGTAGYLFAKKHRKQTLNNLALARSLDLSNDDAHTIAKESFQNLCVVTLELFRLGRRRCLDDIISCENPKVLERLCSDEKGFVVFCAHQANWELTFLHMSSYGYGVGIGKPQKNPFLYRWLLGIREMFGGTIVDHKNALSPCVKALKQGHLVGIVADQGFPESSYSTDFFGTKASSSMAPALLAYKADANLCVATIYRNDSGNYTIRYSEPIVPDTSKPFKEEVPAIMDDAIKIVEKGISEHPGQWLWQHKRWKQHQHHHAKRQYRYDTVGIVMPKERKFFDIVNKALPLFRAIYPKGMFSIMVPEEYREEVSFDGAKILPYKTISDALIDDYFLQIVFDFSGADSVVGHYKRFSIAGAIPLKSMVEKTLSHEYFLEDLATTIIESHRTKAEVFSDIGHSPKINPIFPLEA